MTTRTVAAALLATVAMAASMTLTPAYAQTNLLMGSMRGVETRAASSAPSPIASTEDITAQIETLTAGLQQAQSDLAAQRNRARAFIAQQHPESDLIEDTTQILALIVSRYQHGIDGLKSLQRLSHEVEQKERDLRNWRPPLGGPPWSIQLADETFVTMTQSKALSEQYARHEHMLMRSRDNLEAEKKQLETKIRQQRDAVGLVGVATDEVAALGLEKLQASLKATDLELLFADVFLQTNRLNKRIADLAQEISQKDWLYMDGRFAFSQSAYERIVGLVDQQIARVRGRLEQVQQNSVDITERYEQAVKRRAELEQSDAWDEQGLLAATRAVTLASDRAKLQRMRRDVGFYQAEMLQIAKQLWEIRYDLYQGKRDDAEMRDLQSLFGDIDQELSDWRDYVTAQTNEMRKEKQAFLDSAVLSPTVAEGDFLRERAHLMQQRIDVDTDSLAQIESTEFLLELTAQDLDRYSSQASFKQTAMWAARAAKEFATGLWNFELFTVSDTVNVQGRPITTERSVTIGKSFGALFILIFGVMLVKRIVSRALALALRRSRIQQSTSMLVGRWVTLFAGLTLIIFSLILVDIPLSIFAFAGGALAIGLGFGAQNLLQNLISGLMLLIEKPVRVGDWIEVGGLTGTVTSIGIRFSTLLSPTGTENLVPNSVLVQEKLVNWTYSSPEVRREIEVWVDYDNDPTTVTHILVSIAQDHPVVLETPEPRVLLNSFTERGMHMKLQFWAPMLAHLSGPVVMSEIRREIHARFTTYGIEFASPRYNISMHTDETPKQKGSPTPAE
jgi:small-conductance mechanosensitive channel